MCCRKMGKGAAASSGNRGEVSCVPRTLWFDVIYQKVMRSSCSNERGTIIDRADLSIGFTKTNNCLTLVDALIEHET